MRAIRHEESKMAWIMGTWLRLVAASAVVAAGQAFYFVYAVRAEVEVVRAQGWESTTVVAPFVMNLFLGMMPLAGALVVAYVTRGSRGGQLAAVLVGAALWLLVVAALMGVIFSMPAKALWPYPVLGLLTFGLALLARRDPSSSRHDGAGAGKATSAGA